MGGYFFAKANLLSDAWADRWNAVEQKMGLADARNGQPFIQQVPEGRIGRAVQPFYKDKTTFAGIDTPVRFAPLFLTLARHENWQTEGYIDYAHPVQQRVLGLLESMYGVDLSAAPWGIDGCGIPTFAAPLANIALAMARLGVPDDQPARRQDACARVRRAMAAHPLLVAGGGRFCSRVIAAAPGRALVKTGAEGVFAACFPDLGLGVALKAEDGATRAAEAATAYLLAKFDVLGESAAAELADLLDSPVTNRAGRVVGRIRTSECLGDSRGENHEPG